jgi:hypothetical protein
VATAVYALCAITATACAALLARSYLATRSRLLLWATFCFVGLAGNNVALFIDKVVVTDTDLSTLRTLPAFAGLVLFALGLIWEDARGRSR